ncbi:hypothetical protein ASE74_12230 [Pedobacter sp. Leaf216]|nr:hypothetical protein ASE74_12230 [Pedobacter sp. Leaf216]
MKCLQIIFLIIFICFAKPSFAAEGCLVGNTVYPNFAGYSTVNLIPLSLGTKTFYITSPYSTAYGTCPGWVNINSSGGSCIYGNPTLGANLGGLQIAICVACPTGTLVDYTFVNCNLDDYSWPLATAAGIFGIFIIRRRNKF